MMSKKPRLKMLQPRIKEAPTPLEAMKAKAKETKNEHVQTEGKDSSSG